MTTDGTLTAERRGTPAGARTGPVSYGQERLWYLDRFEGAGASYNVPEAYRLRGPLDAPALARALSGVVARHPALRARFLEEGEKVLQRIDPPAPVGLQVADLSGLPAERRDAEADELARLEANQPFDLVRGRLLRARLIRLEEHRHDLLLTVHHAVTDGWSHGILRDDLGALYDARVRGVEAELPEPSIDYLEWVRAERDRLESEALREGLEFWRERLAGVETLELPTDRPRREAQSFRGATLTHELPATIGDGVRELSRAHRSSGFMVLLAGFEALLLRSTDQRRVAVGLPVANRKGPETERLIAYLVNMVALPADLSGDPSFAELLGRVRSSVLDAYPHLHVPFGRLVEELQPKRRLGRTPLFQVSFQLFHEELEPPALTGLEVERRDVNVERAKFDLDLAVFDQGGDLTVRARFSRDLFDDTTVARLLGHLESLLTAAVEEPERRLGALPVLSRPERHQVLVEWSVGATSGPAPEASLGELFVERAAASPDAVALVDGDRHVTYGALERRSASLAGRLRELGVGVDTPVGLAVERSAELVVGVLGIVRAGGGYVPLDASYPEERLAFVLEDLELPVLVADAEGAERVPRPGTSPGNGPRRPGTSPGPTPVLLSRVGPGLVPGRRDRPPGLVPGRPDRPPDLTPARPGPDALAYVVYTSGSTGRPKGVAVPQRAVTRLVRGSAFARFGPEETFFQLAPVAFDASTLELWGPLLHGGRLVVAPPGPLAVEDLAGRVAAQRVTTLWLTAGLFHQVAEAALADLAGVRQLLAGGDVLAPEVCRRVLDELPGTRLINGYGPTENTTFTCCHPIGSVDTAGSIPIGRPVARTSVYAVDRDLRPVPAGVPGELVTGGAGVARGYAGRPALTAERFVPDPFAGPESPGARLYRTGDRVRVRPDGVVEFLGRLDRQVKVRGFRIEPGEIEAVLTAHPAVAEAAVVARKPSGAGSPAGDEQLVAYLVPGDGRLDDREARESLTRALRHHLSARLPGSMVPSVLAFLEEMPLGPTGKVDRAKLALREIPPDAADATAHESAEQDPPKTPTERAIAAMWRDLLGLERVGATDDFFRCGGHSLLATRLLTRLRRDFGVELPLQELFADPTVRGLAERIERRRPAPSRERSRRRSRSGPRRARRTRLVRSGGRRGAARRREPTGPPSYGQERLWYLDRFEGAGSTYNVPEAHRFLGSLDAPALARALAHVVDRHDALRARFVEEGEGVVQRIEPPGRFPGLIPLPVVDLTGLPLERRPEESERILWSESNRPFDLARGPLLRARLVRRSKRRHDFLLVAHHAVTDGWSRQVVLRELETLYGAFTRGKTPDLPEPSLRYLDWAREERRRLEEGSLDDSLEFWREQLTGVEPLELPADRPRPAVRSFRGFRRSRSLPATLGDGVQELCREHRASPFMVLLAGFEALLLRFTAQDRVAVGLPVANRDRPDTQDLVGYCVNMMGLPVDLTGEPTFLELLGRVRRGFLEAYAHRRVPFGRVVEDVQPERDASRTPLFQVTFQVLHDDLRPLSFPGAAVDVLPVELDSAKFDLELAVVEEQGELGLRAYASEDLFEATTVDRLLGYLASLYREVVEDPDRRVRELPILSAAERHQLLVDWNARAFPTPRRRLDAAVRERARARPDAVAVAGEGEYLTYGVLARRAERLRGRLVAAGVGTETPVGLFLGRSAELATAVLAVLEAGGCFVPLDPSHPAERLAFMVEDCGAPVVVTRRDLADELPDGLADLGVRVVHLEEPETDPPDAPAPPPEGDAERLAYVLYTSGSTGRPKGVACAHLGVVNLLRDFERRRAIRPGERCGWWTSPSFDVTIYEVFSALTAGATLCPVPEEIQPDGPRFVEWLAERRVASAYVPPFALPDLAEHAGDAPPLSNRLLVGVEPIDEELLVTVAERCPGLHVVNGYGPTEATVCATLYDLPERPSGAERTPIGRPVHNDRIYLLDEGLEPVPRGVPGELFIGGPGLARGYAGRPARTAEAFVPDPFAGPDRPGARLYRTGDHARHLRSGDLLFLGRLDQQVKVRGMRIELGEVEAALMRHDGVRRVLAMVRDAPAGDRRLVAYAVTGETPGPEPEALRRLARESLPEPMVPSAVVVVDRLPLTPTGKVDREALPEPAWEEAATGGAGVGEPPRTETERLIAGIWCQVLGIERPGRHDDFFDLGGHSLLGTRVVARIRSTLGIELPIRKLFQNPTIAGLAAVVEEARRAGDDALPALRPVPRDGELPLSFSQLRQWFLVELEPRSPVYNLPLALRLAGPLHRPSLDRALQGVVARHEVLRTCFESVDGRPVQRIASRVEVPLPLVDLSAVPVGRRLRELEDRTAVEARRPFDLTRVPLLRCVLFDLGDRAETGTPEHLLWLNVHHIVFDGWSFDVFTRDLARLYRADRSGEAPSLPELPVQYADYAHWQRHELVDRVFARQLEHWRERLADAPARLTLPTDRPRPAVQSHRGGSETLVIPAGLTGRLRRLAVDEQGTLFMVLLASYQALLARWSGQEDLTVGTFVANRPWTEIENLVGFFVNTLVLRADLSADPEFGEHLDRVRARTLEAYENQGLPFERLLDVLETERDLSKTPLFQAMFGLQNYAEAGERLPDLDLRPVRLRHGAGRANADLALWVWEREDRMEAWLRYSADLFDATTVRRFLGQLRNLLEAVVDDPARPLSELPLMGPAERHQILWEWNPPEPAPAAGETILDRVARRTEERPDAPAVVDGDRIVTYGELRRRARGLARRLTERGLAEPDAVVAVRLERSAELVVSILGILEAGCCYLPVDPSVPRERAAGILKDAGARALIGDAVGSPEAAGAEPDVPLLRPAPQGEAAPEPPGRGAPEVPPEALAYVIYTSGTTGTPKGVPVDHRALRRFTDTAVARYRLGSGDRVLQFAAPSFDASVEEIFPTLACGAALVLRDETMLTSPERFFDECARRRVTVADLPTAWWHELAAHTGSGDGRPDALRLVIIGGEAALPEAVAAWLAARRDGAEPPELVNTYGPTEATVVTTAGTVEAAPDGARTLPIGRPIAHARVHVLSPELRPVPVGVAGELALGGTGVARGYLGRPAQTARTFVPDPFADGVGDGAAGARLYRSGDLGRYLPDGNLEFLGRIDRQVKVRGYRVEPEGVAAVLAEAPEVREAVVVPHRPNGGEGGAVRLVGYFVPTDGAEPSAAELIRGLRSRLPEYMVPAELVRLESMPLTRTGKVDRAALPEPGSGERAAEEYAPPETATEEALAEMWEDLLDVDRVGLHDDFFDLGGHSLLAPQLIARIDEELGVELPLAVLFEAPTLGRLAVAVEEALMEEIESLSDEEAERLLEEDPSVSEL